MASRPVRLRTLAANDVAAAIEYYRSEGGESLAVGFIDALEQATVRIGRSPHLGSPRLSYELGIPELRVWSLRRFRYLIFYVPHDDHIDVWRVLHSRRDVPSIFADEV